MNNSTKYFFSRCNELLHHKTFDSYRVKLHSPYSIFKELDESIIKLNKKRIKHFDPTISSIGEEAKTYLENDYLKNVFVFQTFSRKQIIEILNNTCVKIKDGKRNRTLSLVCKTILNENSQIKQNLFTEIKNILLSDDMGKCLELDTYTSWLLSQILFEGYSRTYVNDRIKKCKLAINNGTDITLSINTLASNFSKSNEFYDVIFKAKRGSSEPIKTTSIQIEEIDIFPVEFSSNSYVNEKFKTKGENESYFKVSVESLDFWSALNRSYEIILEAIEINILHYSENTIIVENQALIIDVASRKIRMQPLDKRIDGFYNYEESEFVRFAENFKQLQAGSVAHEKIRSAIRFYKLGNDSIEIEHKLLNYWIGFEQLYASVDSNEDSITRIKTFFTSMNAVFYWQRRIQYLLKSTNRFNERKEISDLLNPGDANPVIDSLLISMRYESYKNDLQDSSNIRKSIELHLKKMEQHLTRIYRVRNELVHEGRSFLDLYLIAGHLRHYLIFSIEQITNTLSESQSLEHLDDVFVYYENLLTRIKAAGSFQELFDIKEYKGYME